MGYTVDRIPATVIGNVDAVCDNCETKLEINAHTNDATDALELKLIGGYGMFIDPSSGAVDVLFCKSCSKKLLEAFPCLDRLIDAAY